MSGTSKKVLRFLSDKKPCRLRPIYLFAAMMDVNVEWYTDIDLVLSSLSNDEECILIIGKDIDIALNDLIGKNLHVFLENDLFDFKYCLTTAAKYAKLSIPFSIINGNDSLTAMRLIRHAFEMAFPSDSYQFDIKTLMCWGSPSLHIVCKNSFISTNKIKEFHRMTQLAMTVEQNMFSFLDMLRAKSITFNFEIRTLDVVNDSIFYASKIVLGFVEKNQMAVVNDLFQDVSLIQFDEVLIKIADDEEIEIVTVVDSALSLQSKLGRKKSVVIVGVDKWFENQSDLVKDLDEAG
ncbi:MAG: hypothetical protein R3B45_03260 [Bdellovibrionota bacterium]